MYSIDPDQIKWRDIGLKNIDDAGFSPFVRFFREPSAKVLSRLQDEAVVLDFVYIGSTKISTPCIPTSSTAPSCCAREVFLCWMIAVFRAPTSSHATS